MKLSSRLSSAEWEALLARIQSPSKELEAHLAKANSNLIDALSGLEELEKLTELHLAPPAPALPPAPAASAAAQSVSGFQPATSAQAQAMAAQAQVTTPVQYQTSHEEYAPALNQSALVEALLQYQRKKSLRTPKPAASTQARSQNADQIHSTPAFSRSDFSPMRIPEIQAEPKNAPLGRAASPSVRLPVLRLKSESSSSGNPHDDEQN